MSKTEKNLKIAFAGESQANRRYLAFAQKAADEGHDGIAKLFLAVAEAETIHAHKHLAHLKGIGTTEENLNEAISGESHEFTKMYPQMVKTAKEEGAKAAEITLTYAMEVEKVHHKLFKEALFHKDTYPPKMYYICKACGYTAAENLPETCPVCGANKTAFSKF